MSLTSRLQLVLLAIFFAAATAGPGMVVTPNTVSGFPTQTTASMQVDLSFGAANGTSGTISVSGLPVGASTVPATVTYTNAVGATSASTSFAINIGNATPGTYIVTLRDATNGAGTASVTLTVNQPSFSQSATPNPLTLPIGSSQPVTVSTIGDPGFTTTSIDYSFSGFPAFILNDGPKTTTGTAPVSFNFTTGTGATPGTYTGTLSGKTPNGATSKPVPFTVVIPQPDITATFTQPSVSVCNGGAAANDSLQLSPVNGYSGTPSVTFTTIPAGITITPGSFTAKLPPGQILPFTISANGAATGVQTATLTVSDPAYGITKTVQLQINVTAPDFTPGVAPSSLTITAGGAAQSVNASVIANSCQTSNITVNASGAPAGMTINPNPATLFAPGFAPATISIQASASTAPGSYPITLAFTSGNITKTATINVTVGAAPDFVLTLAPSVLTAQAGGAPVTTTATIRAINGFNGTVTVNAPAAADLTITPSIFNLQPGNSQQVMITALPAALVGTRSLLFTATAPGVSGTRSDTVLLTITAGPDFALVANPQVLPATAGGTVTTTISATALNGFTGIVAVTAPVPPNGVTINPSTFSITPGGAGQPVTITIPAGISAQTIPLTFSGTSGSLGPHTATVSVIVTTPPGFILTVTPASLTLPAGSGGSVLVGVVGVNGFTGAVLVTSPSIPGVTFDPPTFTVTPSSPQMVKITIAPTTPAGLRDAFFQAVAAGATSTGANLALTISPRPDFSITAVPAALTIRGTQSATITVTASGVNGFTGPITVTSPNVNGLTFTPASFTLLPGASQQVTVQGSNVSTPVAPKAALFTAIAASGVSHDASVIITLLPPAPTLIAVAPSAIVAGAQSIVVRVAGDFMQPGAIFHSSDPSLVIDGATILTPQLADVTLTTHANAAPGPRSLSVTNPDGGTSATPVVVLVYPASSIAAPLDVTAAAIVFPAKGTMISPDDRVYPRGLLATSGTGSLIGTWNFDGVPFDRFVVNAAGGMPVEVRANMPIPTSFTGTHRLELVVENPRHVTSPLIEIIDAIDRVSRLTILAPRDGAIIHGREQLFRWSLVPNCSGFDVEVALTGDGLLPDALTQIATFRVNDAEWRPSRDDLASIGPGIHRWRVRPRCSGDVDLEPTSWQRFAVLPEHVDITLQPMVRNTVRWSSPVSGLLYRVEFLAPDGNMIFSALTSRTEYTPSRSFPADTTVRVSVLGPNGDLLGTSSSSPLSRRAPRAAVHLVQETIVEIGAVEPPDGGTVTNVQPHIAVQWKGAVKPDQVMLLVDSTDITAVATITPTSIGYDSLIALAPGPHTAAISVSGNIKRWTFNVGGAGGEGAQPEAAPAAPRSDWVIAPVGTVTLVRDANHEARAQLSALTDLNAKGTALTNKATGDVSIRHDFDNDKTVQESRNWLGDIGAVQTATTREQVRVGFAQPDFFDQAQLLSAGLPRGGVQAKVVVPGGIASYYQTFTSRPAGVITGLFGPEQKLKAASFQIPFNARWDFRLLGIRVDEAPSFTSFGGQGNAFGVFARFSIGSTLNAIFEGAHGDFKPALEILEPRQKGNAYRVGLSGMRGTMTYAFNLRRTQANFINPANRGFSPGGVPDRTGADLTLGKFFARSSITFQLRHLQDGTTAGLLVPRTRETGGLISFMKMFGAHVSLALSGNMTNDKGEEKPDIYLPRSDRRQSGVSATLSQFFSKLNFSETLSRQLLRDHVSSLNDQTTTSGTVTAGGLFSQYFNVQALLSGTRSEGSFIIGTTKQYLASLQPSVMIPKLAITLQPRASYSTSNNDLYESKATTQQYQGLVTFAPQWLAQYAALQLSADWTKSTFAGQLTPARFVHRYVGTFNFHWRAGNGPAYSMMGMMGPIGPMGLMGTPAGTTPTNNAPPPHP